VCCAPNGASVLARLYQALEICMVVRHGVVPAGASPQLHAAGAVPGMGLLNEDRRACALDRPPTGPSCSFEASRRRPVCVQTGRVHTRPLQRKGKHWVSFPDGVRRNHAQLHDGLQLLLLESPTCAIEQSAPPTCTLAVCHQLTVYACEGVGIPLAPQWFAGCTFGGLHASCSNAGRARQDM
jgi:hypothetical protein